MLMDPVGLCRLNNASNATGSHDHKVEVSATACFTKCDQDPKCTGLEISTATAPSDGIGCEIWHTRPIQTFVQPKDPAARCYRRGSVTKLGTATTAPTTPAATTPVSQPSEDATPLPPTPPATPAPGVGLPGASNGTSAAGPPKLEGAGELKGGGGPKNGARDDGGGGGGDMAAGNNTILAATTSSIPEDGEATGDDSEGGGGGGSTGMLVGVVVALLLACCLVAGVVWWRKTTEDAPTFDKDRTTYNNAMYVGAPGQQPSDSATNNNTDADNDNGSSDEPGNSSANKADNSNGSNYDTLDRMGDGRARNANVRTSTSNYDTLNRTSGNDNDPNTYATLDRNGGFGSAADTGSGAGAEAGTGAEGFLDVAGTYDDVAIGAPSDPHPCQCPGQAQL